MLARVFEQHGLATTSISLVREHTERVKPPRALFVPFPFGRPLGAPDDPIVQHGVMRAALGLLERCDTPVLVDYAGGDGLLEDDLNLPQASAVRSTVAAADAQDVTLEVTRLRPFYEQWVQQHGGRTNVGLSGVPQRRFRAIVRFLEAYLRDGTLDLPPEAPAGLTPPQFLRWAVDDLKSFYLEARLAQRPDSSLQEINRWLWGETALGSLLRQVGERLRVVGDPKLDALAFGIVR